MATPKEIPHSLVNEVLSDFIDHFAKVRAHKGMFPFVDEYQAFAKIRAELNEFDDAIEHCESAKAKTKELFDLVTGALWTVASYRAGMKEKVKKKGKRTVGLRMTKKQRDLFQKLRADMGRNLEPKIGRGGLKLTKKQRALLKKYQEEAHERLRPHIEAAERSGRITAEDLAIRVD